MESGGIADENFAKFIVHFEPAEDNSFSSCIIMQTVQYWSWRLVGV